MVRKLLRSKGRCYRIVHHKKTATHRAYKGHKLVKCPVKKAPRRKSTGRKTSKKGCGRKVARAIRTIKSCGCSKRK